MTKYEMRTKAREITIAAGVKRGTAAFNRFRRIAEQLLTDGYLPRFVRFKLDELIIYKARQRTRA